ncbi:MAG TPA: choice-of-anchor tandem repeat GloVer-containing protein [Rhizomicrobium sp.]
MFGVNAATGAESFLYSFHENPQLPDGTNPWAGVIYRGDYLYGTTYYGYNENGISYYGVVFKLDPDSGDESLLYSFKGDADGGFSFPGVLDRRRDLYGIGSFAGQGNCGGSGCGVVFKVDSRTGKEAVLHSFTGNGDGGNPEAGLTYDNGAFYGTTFDGGTSDAGTVFKLVP